MIYHTDLEALITGHEALIEMSKELTNFVKTHGKSEKTEKSLERIKKISDALNSAYNYKAKAEYYQLKQKEADFRYLELLNKLNEYETASKL
jgi:outer membrane phospholipase A